MTTISLDGFSTVSGEELNAKRGRYEGADLHRPTGLYGCPVCDFVTSEFQEAGKHVTFCEAVKAEREKRAAEHARRTAERVELGSRVRLGAKSLRDVPALIEKSLRGMGLDFEIVASEGSLCDVVAGTELFRELAYPADGGCDSGVTLPGFALKITYRFENGDPDFGGVANVFSNTYRGSVTLSDSELRAYESDYWYVSGLAAVAAPKVLNAEEGLQELSLTGFVLDFPEVADAHRAYVEKAEAVDRALKARQAQVREAASAFEETEEGRALLAVAESIDGELKAAQGRLVEWTQRYNAEKSAYAKGKAPALAPLREEAEALEAIRRAALEF